MRIPNDLLVLEEGERLVFCDDPVITDDQMAVLIVKPSNNVVNANNSSQNIKSIIGRVEAEGWHVHSLKVVAGSSENIDKIAAHYPQPFYDSELQSVHDQLTAEEQDRLMEIWGEDAKNHALYHPVRLSKEGLMDFATSAKTWHEGRGENNHLLDKGYAHGINSVTAKKDQYYGKRRLFLVRSAKKPFFMVNGFTAELASKFSRPDERIVIMVITKNESKRELAHLREYVIGATNPRDARPGSIRHDALHGAAYEGNFPIFSGDEVGIENNIVHLSDDLAEAKRELSIWMPEVRYYE